MKRFLPILTITLLALPVLAQAATYTYTRTINSFEKNQYALEYATLDSVKKCYVLDINAFASRDDCLAALKKVPSGVTMKDSCDQLTRTSYTYSFSSPVCPASAAVNGLTDTSEVSSGNSTSGTETSSGNSTSGKGMSASGGSGNTLQNPLKVKTLPELLDLILSAVIELGALVLVFMLVWVGFLFVTAQGNPEKVSTARSALLWTVIGGLILLGAKAISAVVAATVQSL